MSLSRSVFYLVVANVLAQLRPATMVDIGAGKYGKLAQRVASLCGMDIYTRAIEIDQHYVADFQLDTHYGKAEIGGVPDFQQRTASLKGDACILGDVFEHLPKSRGMDLLHFLLYHFRNVVVAIPIDMVQDRCMGHAQEAHMSIWYERNFAAFEHAWVVRQTEDGSAYLLAFLNGISAPLRNRFPLIGEQDKACLGFPCRAFAECVA